jgi:hypothetical protein
MAIPVGGTAGLAATAGKLALAGALPGALEYGSAGDRAKRGAMGAAGAVAGGVVVPKVVEAAVKGVPAVGRAVRAAVEPLTEKGRATIAGRTLVNAAGDEAPTVAQRLAQAGELVPGLRAHGRPGGRERRHCGAGAVRLRCAAGGLHPPRHGAGGGAHRSRSAALPATSPRAAAALLRA